MSFIKRQNNKGGNFSNSIDIKSGFSQGSVMGSLLCVLLVNGLDKCFKYTAVIVALIGC